MYVSIYLFDGKLFNNWIAPATCSFILAKTMRSAGEIKAVTAIVTAGLMDSPGSWLTGKLSLELSFLRSADSPLPPPWMSLPRPLLPLRPHLDGSHQRERCHLNPSGDSILGGGWIPLAYSFLFDCFIFRTNHVQRLMDRTILRRRR